MGSIAVGERFASVVVANNGVVNCDAEAEAAGGIVMARGTSIVVLDAGARERVMALLLGCERLQCRRVGGRSVVILTTMVSLVIGITILCVSVLCVTSDG